MFGVHHVISLPAVSCVSPHTQSCDMCVDKLVVRFSLLELPGCMHASFGLVVWPLRMAVQVLNVGMQVVSGE